MRRNWVMLFWKSSIFTIRLLFILITRSTRIPIDLWLEKTNDWM